jgi:mannose-6-phosphate isomerase-like protein (cupin superfamily)
VVTGEGEVTGPTETTRFGPGQVIFIAPDEEHQFRNTGPGAVLFVCSIPKAALTAYYLEQADDGGS